MKNKVIMLGVPSYTSGAQTLNGTTVNLNNKLEYINIKLKIISLLYFVVNKNKDNSFKLVKPSYHIIKQYLKVINLKL